LPDSAGPLGIGPGPRGLLPLPSEVQRALFASSGYDSYDTYAAGPEHGCTYTFGSLLFSVWLRARPEKPTPSSPAFLFMIGRSGQDLRAGIINGWGPLVRSSQPVQEGPPSVQLSGGPSFCPQPRSYYRGYRGSGLLFVERQSW
jgi:hypothetical protein